MFAGDAGYDITVQKHTALTGGLLTSTAKAEVDRKNRFSAGTWASLTTGDGSDSDNQRSQTNSGINTANIDIRDENAQRKNRQNRCGNQGTREN